MGIDQQMLDRAAQLPEKQLSEMIYAVITAAGGSRMQARAAAANAGKIKKKLESITLSEVEDMTKDVDAQTMEKIVEAVKKNGGEERG